MRRLIARGGMGRVYEGWHRTFGIPVALKIIDPHLIGEDHIRARFEKEAMTLARLQEPVSHPNIVRIIDFKLLENVGCIVMAYINGMDLRSWCVKRELETNERVGLIEQVARAAGYFHSFGLVHRDLKPANVLVREGCGDPVIVDFGIVRGREDLTLTRTQQALGTAAYMAPEVLGVKGSENYTRSTTTDSDAEPRSPGEISPTADVYALGVMLYELLWEELPYGSTLAEVLPKHQKESPPSTSMLHSGSRRFPRDLERVCLKAIAHRPAERYANGTALAEDLARYQRGEPVLARPISKIRHAARRARQKPLLCTAAGVGIVLALLAISRLIWDMEQVELASLREQISVNMPTTSWSSQQMLKTDRLIDELATRNPRQADFFHHNLIQGAVREIENELKQPRITDAAQAEIKSTLAWIKAHDKEAAARLQTLFEERLARWATVLDIKPPFANLHEVFLKNSARTDGGLMLTATGSPNATDLVIEPQFPTPLETSVSFMPGKEAAQMMGVRMTLNEGRSFDLRYYQPVPTNSIKLALESRFPGREMPPAALVISDRTEILAVAPVTTVLKPGQPLHLKIQCEGTHLFIQTDGQTSLNHRLKYQADGTAKITLYQSPAIQVQSIRWNAAGHPANPSPLELGDSLAAKQDWSAAATAFLAVTGDPAYGPEALYKAGDCQHEAGLVDKAQTTWLRVMDGPDSEWRKYACLRLWMLHAKAGRLEKARIYLDQLPSRQDMPEGYIDWITESKQLSDSYRAQARGLHLLHPVPEVEDAIRVHQLLNFQAPDLATRFSLALHFNGADEATRDLLHAGLKLQKPSKLNEAQIQTLNTCLELRTLTALNQAEPEIIHEMEQWRKAAPKDHSIALTVQIEQARRHARNGEKARAVELAQQVLDSKESTIMAFTGAALLLHTLGADPEQKAVLHAIERVPLVRRQVQELTLMHRLLLHSVAKNWTSRSMVEILANYLSLGFSGEEHDILRGRISRFLLDDQAMVNSLNHLLDGQNGQELLLDIVLRRKPIRDLAQELFYAVLRRHVIFSVYGESSTTQQMKTAAHAVYLWLKAYSERQISDDDFFILMQGWRGPEPAMMLRLALPRLPAPLRDAVLDVFESRSTS